MDNNENRNAPPYEAPANEVAADLDADVFFFNGPLEGLADRAVIERIRERQRRRKNVFFVLVTYGGDANEAYRIARFLQRTYDRVVLLVSGMCKSAGALVTIGAHELVMADDGQMGPLDVQLWKKDELGETESGLTVTAALETLNEQAFMAFEHFLLETKRKGQPTITLRLAVDVAVRLTTGLFQPIYQQFDPMHVGVSGRAMDIAEHYGFILAHYSQNLQPGMLEHLTSHFPSHDFTIDFEQAERIFSRVRKPTDKESRLIQSLADRALWPVIGEGVEPFVLFLSSEVAPQTQTNVAGNGGVERAEPNGGTPAEILHEVAGTGSPAAVDTDGAQEAKAKPS